MEQNSQHQRQPVAYFLIGVPGSGKTYYINNTLKRESPNAVVLSTDDYIEAAAARQGKTYNDVFGDAIKAATESLKTSLKAAVSRKRDIIWDQTNTSIYARKGKLAQIPDDYKVIAIVFRTPPPAELDARLASRTGKTIPADVMGGMMKNFQMPTKAEGFDELRIEIHLGISPV